MAERATISQGVQWGVEGTYGVSTAANKKMSAMGITLTPHDEFQTFRAMGYKAPSLVNVTKRWAEGDLEGAGTYTELVYPLSSVIDVAAITTPSGATLARQWEFIMDPTGADSPKSFTVETGDGVTTAEKSTGVIINELTLDIDLDGGVVLGGSVFGRALQTGITMTASPTAIDLVPILGTQVSVYLDDPGSDSEAALGTTKLTRAQSVNITIGDRYSMVWALDAAQTSYVAFVETEPTLTVELNLEADATGMGLLATADAGATKMLRVEAIGAEIETDNPYRFTFDAAVKISDIGGRDDSDGLQVIPYTFQMVYDADWAKAFRVQLVNQLTSL